MATILLAGRSYSVTMIVEIGSRQLAGLPLFDKPKETYAQPYADMTL